MTTQFGVRPWIGNPKFQPQRSLLPKKPPDLMAAALQAAIDAPKPTSIEVIDRRGEMRAIAEEVAAKHGLTSWRELRSHRRNPRLCAAKREAWWRCRNETDHSYPAIGRFFGFDHTTILAAVRKYEAAMTATGSEP